MSEVSPEAASSAGSRRYVQIGQVSIGRAHVVGIVSAESFHERDQVRALLGSEVVEKEGKYREDLSRLPFHLESPLTVAGPGAKIGGVPIIPGEPLPVHSASLRVNGGSGSNAAAGPDAKSIRFEVSLQQGKHTLQGRSRNAGGEDIFAVYYGLIQMQMGHRAGQTEQRVPSKHGRGRTPPAGTAGSGRHGGFPLIARSRLVSGCDSL